MSEGAQFCQHRFDLLVGSETLGARAFKDFPDGVQFIPVVLQAALPVHTRGVLQLRSRLWKFADSNVCALTYVSLHFHSVKNSFLLRLGY